MLAARMAQEQTTEAVSRAVTVVNRLSMDDRRAMKNLGGAGCGHFEISNYLITLTSSTPTSTTPSTIEFILIALYHA